MAKQGPESTKAVTTPERPVQVKVVEYPDPKEVRDPEVKPGKESENA